MNPLPHCSKAADLTGLGADLGLVGVGSGGPVVIELDVRRESCVTPLYFWRTDLPSMMIADFATGIPGDY